MKKIAKIMLLSVLSLLLLESCDDGKYSLDKSWIAIATVDNPEEAPYFFLHLDNDTTLWVGATDLRFFTPKTGQRVIANYTILSDREGAYQHDVKLNDAYNVLTKDIFNITPATQDSIGNDIIKITELNIGGGFINVAFQYGGEYMTHFINLVYDELSDYNDGKIHLEFRHNTNGDNQRFLYKGVASFNLASLPLSIADGDVTNIVIHVKEDTNKEVMYELQYKNGSDAKEVKTMLLDISTLNESVKIN